MMVRSQWFSGAGVWNTSYLASSRTYDEAAVILQCTVRSHAKARTWTSSPSLVCFYHFFAILFWDPSLIDHLYKSFSESASVEPILRLKVCLRASCTQEERECKRKKANIYRALTLSRPCTRHSMWLFHWLLSKGNACTIWTLERETNTKVEKHKDMSTSDPPVMWLQLLLLIWLKKIICYVTPCFQE